MAQVDYAAMDHLRARNDQNRADHYPMTSFTALPKSQPSKRWQILNATPRPVSNASPNGTAPEPLLNHRPFVHRLPDRPADSMHRSLQTERLPSVQSLLRNDTPPGSELNGAPPAFARRSSPLPPPSYFTPPPSAHSHSDARSHSLNGSGPANLVDTRPPARPATLLPPLKSSYSSPAKHEGLERATAPCREQGNDSRATTTSPQLAQHSQARAFSAKRRKSELEGERSFHSHDSSVSSYADRPRSSASTGSVTYRRYLGQKEIPGKGLCHVYDDGYDIPVTIEGEPVNPDWGVTKAGKPRKRLAHACTNCREKKIKCEPGIPSCSQCLKLGRECSRSQDVPESPESAASNHISPAARWPAYYSGSSQDARHGSPREANTPGSARVQSLGANSTHVTSLADDFGGRRAKRPRSQSTEPDRPQSSTDRSSIGSHHMTKQGANEHGAANSLEIQESKDPYDTNPSETISLLELYFHYRDTQTSKLLPKESFMRWVKECKTKSDDDRMVIYATLALGSVFADSAELKSAGKKCANAAKLMEQDRGGKMNLQMAHTRLHLSLYHHSKEGRTAKHVSLDYRGGAWRVSSVLGLNTEAGIEKIANKDEREYGLSRVELMECCRRTFWLVYVTDGTGGYCAGHAGLINNDDALARLPNDEVDYAEGRDSVGPFFDRETPGACSLAPHQQPGATAMMVAITSVWKEVCAFNYRSMHRPYPPNYQQKYLKHYEAVTARLHHFESSLPQQFRRSTDNTRAAISGGYFMTYYCIHSLFYSAAMKLHRFGHIESLERDLIIRHICKTHRFAREFLSIVKTLSQHLSSSSRTEDIDGALSTPFTSCAVLTACEVISSGGTLDMINATQTHLSQAKAVIEHTARFFGGARKQCHLLEDREIEFNGQQFQGLDMRTWRMTKRIESIFMPEELDLIYGVPRDLYRDAIAELNTDASDERTPRQ